MNAKAQKHSKIIVLKEIQEGKDEMMESQGILTGVERTFDAYGIIVSKTDIKGRITYVNRVFMRVAGYPESALIKTQHSIV